MAYLEENRYLYLKTPLGPNDLLLRGFGGHEALSRLFSFQLDLMAMNSTVIDFNKLIGQKASFGVVGNDAAIPPRDLSGLIVEFSQGGRTEEFTTYHMTVVPDVWPLTCIYRSRIFQRMTVPDILKKVLSGFEVNYELQGTYEPREYVVQYQESDFDFASRLMEEEGIFYFFKFTPGTHKMIVADQDTSHSPIPGRSSLIFETVHGGDRAEERIVEWSKAQRFGAGKFLLWDHHFQLPHKKLEADKTILASVQAGKVNHQLKIAGNDQMEVYENPGGYARRFDGINKTGGEQPAELQKVFTDNGRTVKIRTEQGETGMLTIQGQSYQRQLTAGHKFSLQRHFNADGDYVLTSVSHSAAEGEFRSESAGGTSSGHYSNSFTCIPIALPFRPLRITRRPMIHGPQSAVVVGPKGEEIFTDKYGRVKVQFHWDREGKQDPDSSCWLRVTTSWAGNNWGAIHIPRIGQEVIVSFLEGDPDRPIIIGSVYNAEMMPPYKLPDHKTQSGIKSHSSLRGGADNYNQIRFEDKKGEEQVWIHAEKNMLESVENDQTITVGGNRSMTVGTDKGGGVLKELIYKDRHLHVKKDERTQIDGKVSWAVTGDEIRSTTGGIYLSSQKEVLIDAPQIFLSGQTKVTLAVGGSYIVIDASGVTIMGPMVNINSPGSPAVPIVPPMADAAEDP